MYIIADSLDDLLFKAYGQIRSRGVYINPTKGEAYEINGALLRLSSPRARLSRTESRGLLFSCLGELLWYLAGSNRLGFIEYYIRDYKKYSDDGQTIYGGYGPRIFGKGPNAQIFRVIRLLKKNPHTRRAVIQIFDRKDILKHHEDVPCTCTLQFMVRKDRLNLLVSMRSNDAWKGLPHDVFTFTMIQELVARSLNLEIGDYKHYVGSLHLYKEDIDSKVSNYIHEGWQSYKAMSPMPLGDPWESVKHLLEFEELLRTGGEPPDPRKTMKPYWADLAILLSIYSIQNTPNVADKIRQLKKCLSSGVYSMYIEKRLRPILPSKVQRTIFDELSTTSSRSRN